MAEHTDSAVASTTDAILYRKITMPH